MGVMGGTMTAVRSVLAAMAGLTFGGARDLYKVFGWNRQPNHRDFLAKYLRQDITQRIINAPVGATWTDHPMLTGDKTFNDAWETLVKEHDLYHYLAKVDTFAGLGAFAVLVVGIDDGKALSTPVNSNRENKITYLQPYLEGSVEVIEFDTNETSKRFGKPTKYRITPGESIIMRNSVDARLKGRAKFEVHWSRILHVADNTLENPIFGHSRLESIYNVLDDILKVTGGSAETYWLAANRGIHVDVDKEMELDPDDAENLSDEIEDYQHQLSRVIRTRGTKVNNLGSDVADPKNTFNVQVALLSSNTSIPQRVLMGAEAGQLASQQDRANWANFIATRIGLFAEPVILKPFLAMLINMGVLKAPTTLKIEWPEPFKMNPLERAQTSAQQARSITNVARALETAQKVQVDLVSVEESRQMVAPGDKLLIMEGKPAGGMTYPPRLSAPYNEPQNKAIGASPEVPEGDADGNSPASQPGSSATSGTPGAPRTDDD
jgi:hypothetical protein